MNIRMIRAPKKQSGAALMVVLILLLVMTLLGLASLRGTLMEERMSANLLDRSLAFQAAEAALREGEAAILANGRAGFPVIGSGGCNGNLCDQPTQAELEAGYVPRADRNGAHWGGALVDVGDVAIQPEFFIEYMGEAPSWPRCDSEIPQHPSCLKPRYRVSARSTAADRAQVVLQSNLAGS
ncbi:pilus assembly PilX family protein [Lysobacter sp. A3-1-A15]|uniref:pilus assembly PilX family protein n=1 Tax=Novilysobacter viscosus TaxID=3098602 RepID=UPI002EDB9281